jgi:hypothetical protein
MVQFSLRIRHILGVAIPLQPRAGGADAAELPVAAERGGDDFLAFGGLRAEIGRHRQRPGHDVIRQLAQAVDFHVDHVAGLDRAGVGRRPGQQHVARAQRDRPRDVGDQVVHVPLHLVGGPVLREFAVDVGAQPLAAEVVQPEVVGDGVPPAM